MRILCCLFLAASSCFAQSNPPQGSTAAPPLRPEFTQAVETVIDADDGTDCTAPESTYAAQLQRAKEAMGLLSRMAASDYERSIARATSEVLQVTSTCRITVEISGDSYERCEDRRFAKRRIVLAAIRMHKMDGVWEPD
jgi:hypothetical protein